MKKLSKIIFSLAATCIVLSSCAGSDIGTDTSNDTMAVLTAPDISKLPEIPTISPSDTTSSAVTDVETMPIETEPTLEPEYTYATDVSKYLEYIDPEDRDAYLILVNRDNMLDEDFVPEKLTDLVDTRDDGRDKQQMVRTAAKALEAFLKEAREAGCKNITVTSGYRSYSRQDYLFNIYTNNAMNPDEIARDYKTKESLENLVNNLVGCLGIDESKAQDIADKIEDKEKLTKEEALLVTSIESCPAGASEHQSGLCIDMHNLSSAKVEFAETEEAKWLAENCYKFGFIVRFPENKPGITKISYEPWHFRFVGRYHAQRMHDLDMCLEEYIEHINE